MKTTQMATATAILTVILTLAGGLATASDQTWTGGSAVDGNWSTGANWSGGAAPGSTTVLDNGDVATFNAAIANTWGNAAGNPVVIDSASQNIGGLTFTGSPGNYFIGSTGGNSLLLSSGGAIQVTGGLGVTNPVFTINAPVQLQGAGGGSYTFSNDMAFANVGSYAGLQILGGVTGVATAGNNTELLLTGSNQNQNSGYRSSRVSDIGDGTAGGTVSIRKTGSGAWVLGGANTFSGGVTLDEGVLVIGSGTASTPIGSGTLTINGGVISGNPESGSVSLASNPVIINGDFTARGEYYITLGPATLGTAPGSERTIVGRTNAYLTINGIANGTTADSLRLGNGSTPTSLSLLWSAATYTGTTTFANNSGMGWGANAANNYASSLFRFEGNSGFRPATFGAVSSYGDLEFAAGSAWLGNMNRGNNNSWADFASTARATGATADIHPDNASPTTQGLRIVGLTEGLIDQGYFYKGTDFAYVNDPAATGGNYVRAPVYDTDANFSSFAGGASIPDSATTNYNLTGAVSAQSDASVNTLRIDGASAIDLTQSGGTTLTLASGGLLRSGGGATTIGGGTLAVGNDVELVVRTNVAADAIALDSPFVANGVNALTKTGLGTLTLSAANTHTGMTSLNQGTLVLADPLALQNSTFRQYTGNSLNFGASFNAASALVFDAAVTGNAFTFGGLAGGTNISLRNSTNTAGIALTVGGNDEDTAYSGNLSGAGGALIKTGNGTLVLSGSNTHTGGTTIASGTLQATRAAALSGYNVSGRVNVNSGATLAVSAGGANEWDSAQIGALLGVSPSPFAAGSFLGIDTSSGDFTYTGNTSGAQGLTKLGDNSLILTGAISHTGGTTVREGTLRLDGATVTGNVVVESGAVLGGSGTIGSGLITVQAGGTLAPGATPGILTVDQLLLENGSVFEVELFGTTAGSGYDQVIVTGDIDIETGAILDLALNFNARREDTFTIAESLETSGFFTYGSTLLSEGDSFNVDSYVFGITYAGGAGNDIVLTVLIPEPASFALLTLLGSALLLRRQRRP